MGFKIKKFSVNDDLNFNTPLVQLSKNETDPNQNYFSVIIGNNGSGKSRFISYLVDAFREIGNSKRRDSFEYSVDYIIDNNEYEVFRKKGSRLKDAKNLVIENEAYRVPTKIIAISTSLSDKFPNDFSNRTLVNFDEVLNENSYVYLGPRTITNSSSSRALMDKALNILLSGYEDSKNAQEYRHIFDYLDYEPVIKLNYKVLHIKEFFRFNNLTGEILKSYVQHLHERSASSFNYSRIQKSLSQTDIYWSNLAKFYNEIIHKQDKTKFTIELNFSAKNIERIKSGSEDSLKNMYQALNELQYLKLIQKPSVKLFKKHGGEFDFSGTSSGEASILSTLISLVPLVEDNSLIVIDEPEISLHPTWQYKYVGLIDKILENKTGCHVFIATHSHFIISDLPINRSSVIVFKSEGQSNISVNYIDQQTYGWSAEDILLNVFELPSTRNFVLSQEVSEALELLANGKKHIKRYIELIQKFRTYSKVIKSDDPLKELLETLINIK